MIKYNLYLLKKNPFIILLFVTIILLITLSLFIPNFNDSRYYLSNNPITDLEIERYNHPEYMEDYNYYKMLYSIYLKNDMSENNFILFGNLFVLSNDTNYNNIAYGMSLIHGFSLFSIFISIFVSFILFMYPLETKKYKTIILFGKKRDNIFKENYFLGVLILLSIWLIVFLLGIIIINKNFQFNVIINYKNYLLSINLFNIYLSISLGFLLELLFFYNLSIFIEIVSKKMFLAISLPVILFIIGFMLTLPSYKGYGNILINKGDIKFYLSYLSFGFNLVSMSLNGFNTDYLSILLITIILIYTLYYFSNRLFKRIIF